MASFLYIVLRGMAIGLLISAPMGPIGMLCIQRTLNKGRWPAFFTGVGAALSDLIYCLLTGLCLSFITDFVETNQLLLQIIGSLVLAAFCILPVPQESRSLAFNSKRTSQYLLEGLCNRIPSHILQPAYSIFHNRSFCPLQLPVARI